MATRYRTAIVRVLNHYSGNPQALVTGLDVLIQTAIDQTQAKSKEELAVQCCKGYHEGAPGGLVCGRCFDAVEAGHLPDEEVAAAPLTASQQAREGEIEKQVRMLIGMEDKE